MKIKITFHLILTLLLFSLWAAFALLVVNPFYTHDLPGYTIGRICIWEYVAIGIAAGLAALAMKKWGYPSISLKEQAPQLTLHAYYAYFLVAYLVLALSIGIWQFHLFSQQF